MSQNNSSLLFVLAATVVTLAGCAQDDFQYDYERTELERAADAVASSRHEQQPAAAQDLDTRPELPAGGSTVQEGIAGKEGAANGNLTVYDRATSESTSVASNDLSVPVLPINGAEPGPAEPPDPTTARVAAVGFSNVRQSGRYRVAIDAQVNVVPTAGESKQMNFDSVFEYSWIKKTGNEVELILHSIRNVSTYDGARRIIRGSRKEFGFLLGEQVKSVAFDNAPNDVRRLLASTFEVPLCRITLDERGDEVTRSEMVPGAGNPLVDRGIVANTSFMHTRFHDTLETWTAQKQLSIGQGTIADGWLRYRKQSDEDPTAIEVRVDGVITTNARMEDAEIRNARYEISGSQFYNVPQLDYVRGSAKIQAGWDSYVKGRRAARFEGTVSLRFQRLPEE